MTDPRAPGMLPRPGALEDLREGSGVARDGTGPRHPRRVHTDVVIAAVIIGLCLLIWAGTMTFDEVPAALTQGMGPAAFPRLILGVMIVLALWLALSSRGRPDEERPPIHRMVYLTLLAGLAFVVTLVVFGIYGSIAFALLGIGRLWGERRWLLLAAVAVGLAAATHLVFETGFKIPLPQGLIGRWLT